MYKLEINFQTVDELRAFLGAYTAPQVPEPKTTVLPPQDARPRHHGQQWTSIEDTIIIENYGTLKPKQIAERLGRKTGATYNRIFVLRNQGKLHKKKVSTSRVMTVLKNGGSVKLT